MVEGSVEQRKVSRVGIRGGDLGQDLAVPGILGLLCERLTSRPGWNLRIQIRARLLR